MTTDNFTTSGFGELFLTTAAKELPDQPTVISFTTGLSDVEMDNSLLLLVVIAICSITLLLLLLLCILYFCCKKKIFPKNWNHRPTVNRLVLLSKSTSVTGLNEGLCDKTGPEKKLVCVELLKQGANFKRSHDHQTQSTSGLAKLKASKKQMITSTPITKKETHNSLFSSPQRSMSEQCQPCDEGADLHSTCVHTEDTKRTDECDKCNKKVVTQIEEKNGEDLTSPMSLNCPSSIDWGTTRMFQSANSDTSPPQTYATALSHVLESSELLLNNDDHANKDKELLSDCDIESSKSNHISIGSELNCSSFSGITSTLPVDVHKHSKSWFVPLKEAQHEPLRHSVIDVSNQHHNSEQRPLVSKENTCIEEKEAKNLHNPSDCNNKKNSLWEQREGRPVVFLQNSEDALSPTDIKQEH